MPGRPKGTRPSVGIAIHGERQRFSIVPLSPLSQPVLADALGLNSIHVNRVLRQLPTAELLTFHDHRVTIHDRTKLMALAGYEDVEGAILTRDGLQD